MINEKKKKKLRGSGDQGIRTNIEKGRRGNGEDPEGKKEEDQERKTMKRKTLGKSLLTPRIHPGVNRGCVPSVRRETREERGETYAEEEAATPQPSHHHSFPKAVDSVGGQGWPVFMDRLRVPGRACST